MAESEVEINSDTEPVPPQAEEKKRWEFYEVLGVDKNANLDTLRKARKKLALKNHPDKNRKNPEEAQKKMSEINRAFEVLSDPMKRKIYDRYGTEALTFYENKTIPEEMWKIIFVILNQKFILFVGFFSLVFFALLLLEPILIGLRLDNEISMDWVFIIIPLLVLELFLLILLIISFIFTLKYNSEEKQSKEPLQKDSFLSEDKKKALPKLILFYKVLQPVMVIFIIFFQILLALKLDDILRVSWWFIFSPFFFFQLLHVIYILPDASYSSYKNRQSPLDPRVHFYCFFFYLGFLLRAFYTEICLFSLSFLLVLNLQYSDDLSPHVFNEEGGVNGYFNWWYVAMPIFLWVLIRFGLSLTENICFEKLKRLDKPFQTINVEGEDDDSAEFVIENPPCLAKTFSVCCTCIFVSFILITTISFTGWFQSDFTYSAMIMLIPIFILFGCFACICLCCVYPLYSLIAKNIRSTSESDMQSAP